MVQITMEVHSHMSSVTPQIRARISCTECHKRRKRCSEGQPCRNCARRYPPVECIYMPHPKRRPKASVSTNTSGSSQSEAARPSAQLKTGGTARELPNDGTSSSQNAKYSILGDKTPGHGHSLPIEHQIPVCGLSEKAADIRARQTSPVGLQNISQNEPKLPAAFGSGIVDLLPSLEVAPTASNVELFNIYTKVLVPWLFTVDGNPVEPPPDNWGSWIPYSIFNPMILYTNLHRAAIWREMVRPTTSRIEVTSKDIANYIPDCLALRGKALTMLRNHLKSPDAISNEAIATVACFFFNEWSWSIERGTRDILPHIKVLREMVRIRGGMSNLSFHAVGLIMIVHYQLGVVLEREPFVFPVEHLIYRFISDYRPVKTAFDSPLYLASGTFADKGLIFGLHAITVQILDDLALILSAIRSAVWGEITVAEHDNIIKTAVGIEERIRLLRSANEAGHPTSNDYIYETCRLASLIYLRAIINHTQFSKAWYDEELQDMFSSIIKTPMNHWRPLSGVWLFAILPINPPKDEVYPSAMFKFFIRTSAFHMVAWDWQCWINITQSFLALQKWIRSPGDTVGVSKPSSPGIPDIFDVENLQSNYELEPI